MLKGDLASTPLPVVLQQLADGAATGCLNIVDGAGETAKVYLRGGRVYAVMAPGKRPQLGARLVSSGALGPEALAEALEAQRTELQGWRLGELLVHLGYVDQPVVEDFVNEQVRASLSDLLPWKHATWKFRVNERTREDVAPPVPVADLLAEIDARLDLLSEMEEVVGGPDAVPLLSAADTADSETEIDADAWSLLCKVDGVRTVTELARECGFTLYEAGQVVYTLVQAGLLEVAEVEEEVLDAAAFLAEAAEASESDAATPADVAARLAFALSAPPAVPAQRETKARTIELPAQEEEVAGSISRVSEALAALLGPATASDDVFAAPTHRPSSAPPPPPVDPKKVERERLAALRRAADAEELALAQAELEAARAASEASFAAEHGEDHVAEVVDLQEVRAAAEAQAAEEARAAEEAAEEAAEAAAEEAEAARLEEEARLAEEQRLADEAAAEQARLDEEARLAAEAAEELRAQEEAEAAEQARLDEEARLAAEAAEQARLDEEARLAAEAAEQARLDEEARLAAEAAEAAEQARLDEEARLAAEAAEQARLAEIARLEEQAQLEEQARLEQEQRLAEEQRLAQEAAAEQARLEQEQREAAEQAAASEFAALTADLDDSPHVPMSFDPEGQAAAFAELSASAAVAVAEPAPVAAAPVMELHDEPMPSYSQDTDTAALLRELSSLGLDEDPPPPPTRPSRPAAPRPVAAQPKKKKGLFGRG